MPDVVTRTLPERPRAGRIVQSAGAVVALELDPALAERGVILCSLQDAFRDHRELVARVVLQAPDDRPQQARGRQRGLLERRRLPARARGRGRRGAVRDRLRDRSARRGAVRAHARAWAARAASSACTSTTSPRTSRARRCTRARSSCTSRTARAAAWRRCRTGARARCIDVSTRFVGVGRDAYCHWLPALLGGHLVRQHLELAVTEPGGDMAFRGLFFTEEHEHLDVFAVDLHETGPSGGDVHWRGAATGESRASFEGLIQIDPGRAADAHLPADPLDDALAEGAHRRDPLGARVRRRRVRLARRHGRASSTRPRSSTCRRAASTARRRCA